MSNRYKDWFRQADADLHHARNSLSCGDFEWSCFAAHQATEICLIVESSDKRGRDRISEYLPYGFPVGMDIIIYTEKEFLKLNEISPGLYEAINSGKLL